MEEKEGVKAATEAKELTALALRGALSVPHQQRLLALLDHEPNIVYEIGITPNQVIFTSTFLDTILYQLLFWI